MGKSDIIPHTPPKKRVRPISNPLYSDDETFFCDLIEHHHQHPEGQFPSFPRSCSISFKHQARFYLECQAFYASTLGFMNLQESKKSIEDVPSPRQAVDRPKKHRKPSKYGIQPLTKIDESSEPREIIEEQLENTGSSASSRLSGEHDIDRSDDDESTSDDPSLPSESLPANETLSTGFPVTPISSSSPVEQMVQDVEYSSPLIHVSPPYKSLDTTHDISRIPIAKITSSTHDEANVFPIHYKSADPLIEELDRFLRTSQFPKLMYDTQTDRYIKKPNPEMEEGSRFSIDVQVDGRYATAAEMKEEKGKANRMLVYPETAIMKSTNSEGVTGIRPLRMKPQIQLNGLYRDIKNSLGTGDEEVFNKGHIRTASEPERIGSPGTDQQIGTLKSDTEPIRRISRNPYAYTSRKVDDSPTSTRYNPRKKVGPVYLPTYTEDDDDDASPRRAFSPPINTRSPSPRIRSPPPMDRPYRHLSQRPQDGMDLVGTPSIHDRHSAESTESNPSAIEVDLTSFVPPQTNTSTPAVDISHFVSASPETQLQTLPESLVEVPSYTLNLPQIFSSPSPLTLPPRLPSATPSLPSSTLKSNNASPSVPDYQTHFDNSSIYSIYTPDSSTHTSAVIPRKHTRRPSIPSPPTTPTTSRFRTNTTSTIPSTPTQGFYSNIHTRNNTISTQASSIEPSTFSPKHILLPSPSLERVLIPNSSSNSSSRPIQIRSSIPRTNTQTQETIALTDHLVREGIYSGIIYNIPARSPPNSPTFPTSLAPDPTPTQLLRQRRRAAKTLSRHLRKRENADRRARKTAAKAVKAAKKKARSEIEAIKRLKSVKRKVRSKRGTLSYGSMRGVLGSFGEGVRITLQGVRRRLGELHLGRLLLGERRREGGVGDGYDFVCRGVEEERHEREERRREKKERKEKREREEGFWEDVGVEVYSRGGLDGGEEKKEQREHQEREREREMERVADLRGKLKDE